MCGIIGVAVRNTASFPVSKFRKLLHESRIRGLHATGISFLDRAGAITTVINPVPETEFSLPDSFSEDSIIAAISHTRYSTSDLLYNQPIFSKDMALVLNGVISQADPSSWKTHFGVECEGKNDAEILFRVMKQKKHPLKIVNSSQACIVLQQKNIQFWRNEQRPLWFLKEKDHLIVASTKDIFSRSGIEAPIKCDPCVEYTLKMDKFSLSSKSIRDSNQDLQ